MIWGSVIGAVADLAGGYLKGKQEKAQAKQKLEVAKIEAQVQKVAQDGAWEETAIKASDNSWKDELWTCLLCPTHRCLLHTCRTTIHRRRI